MKTMKGVFTTESPRETFELGRKFSEGLNEGDVIGLIGELGSGKTQFVKGIAEGLRSKGYIKSPSFTIINVYEGGRLPLYHIDLYRVGRAEEVFDIGLEEYIYGDGVSVIEWADRAEGVLPDYAVRVRFSYKGEMKREIEVERTEGRKGEKRG